MQNKVMTPEQQALVTDNYKLLLKFVHNKGIHLIHDYDECLSVCQYYFCYAAIAYDPDKSAFSTLAYICMLRGIYIYLRSYKNQPEIVSLDEPIRSIDDKDVPLSEIIPGHNSMDTSFVELKQIISDLLNTYTDRDRNIINDYIYSNDKQQDIGKHYNISQSVVSRIITKFKKDIERMLYS